MKTYQPAFAIRHDIPDDRLRAALAEPWFHSFTFQNGMQTAGRDPSAEKLLALSLPDLSGKSVLDIGAFEGYFSFAAEELGAARVVAADDYVWRGDSHSLAHFRLVREMLGSSVEEHYLPVEHLTPEAVGVFDVVMFLGVLYHAPNMVDYLQHVRAVTGEVAIVETLVDLLDVKRPAASLYPAGSLNDDSSNWWGPNLACVEHLLYRVGFSRVEYVGLWHRNTLAALYGEPVIGKLRSGRAVWHAYV